MTRVEGSQLLYTAGGRPAYLPDGREVSVVVTTEDGSIGVLTDHDRWYVATLRIDHSDGPDRHERAGGRTSGTGVTSRYYVRRPVASPRYGDPGAELVR